MPLWAKTSLAYNLLRRLVSYSQSARGEGKANWTFGSCDAAPTIFPGPAMGILQPLRDTLPSCNGEGLFKLWLQLTNSIQAGAHSAVISSAHRESAGCLLQGLGKDLMACFCHTSKRHCLAKTQLTLAEDSAWGLATAPRGLSCLE